MISRGRLQLFSIAASSGYTLAFYFNWPLLRYYPVVEQMRLFKQGQAVGFAVLWYGWLVSAMLMGVVVALVAPRRWAERLPPDLSWLVSIVLVVAVLVYEKRWFF